MWIVDVAAHPINMDNVLALVVEQLNGSYFVSAYIDAGVTRVASFATDAPMTEPQATALLGRMADMLGVVDLND